MPSTAAHKPSHSLIIGWGQATPRQISAYERLHRELGLTPRSYLPSVTRDSLLAKTEPLERLRLAHRLIQDTRPRQKLFIHAFSDNGFMNWAALCELLSQLPGGAEVKESVACVLLDSAPGMLDQAGDEQLANRIVTAINPAIARKLGRDEKEAVPGIQKILPPIFLAYLKIFPSMGQFMRGAASRLIRFGPRCPYLIWYGSRDEFVQSDKIDRLRDTLRAEGIPIEVECFEGAGHVSLLVCDPGRYRLGLRHYLEAHQVIGPNAKAIAH